LLCKVPRSIAAGHISQSAYSGQRAHHAAEPVPNASLIRPIICQPIRERASSASCFSMYSQMKRLPTPSMKRISTAAE